MDLPSIPVQFGVVKQPWRGVENPQHIHPKQVASYGGFGQQVKRTEIIKVWEKFLPTIFYNGCSGMCRSELYIWSTGGGVLIPEASRCRRAGGTTWVYSAWRQCTAARLHFEFLTSGTTWDRAEKKYASMPYSKSDRKRHR